MPGVISEIHSRVGDPEVLRLLYHGILTYFFRKTHPQKKRSSLPLVFWRLCQGHLGKKKARSNGWIGLVDWGQPAAKMPEIFMTDFYLTNKPTKS